MRNPFVPPKRGAKTSRPLCPWEVEDHASYYVDVDSTGEAFNQFQQFLDQVDVKSDGHAVLACGPDGCGKSALLHRCAHYLKKRLDDDENHEAVVIDLSGDGQPTLPVNQKLGTAWTLIADRIEFEDGLLSDAQLKRLRERDGDPLNGLSYLTRILLGKSKCLLVILPPIELHDELCAYLVMQRRGVFLFCESSNSKVRHYCQKHHGPAAQSPICLMTLDVLRLEDGWKFVSDRIGGADAGFPSVEEAGINEFMQIRGRTTIRELNVACTEVAAHAIHNESQTIGLDDFAHYYLRAGELH